METEHLYVQLKGIFSLLLSFGVQLHENQWYIVWELELELRCK